jgi:hypothetical protein
MKLNLGDFLAMAESTMDKDDLMKAVHAPPFKDTHVFWLGEDNDFYTSVTDIRDDLFEEMKVTVPMPFKDITTVSIVRRLMPHDKPDHPPVWTLDRLVEIPELVGAQRGTDGGKPNQTFFIVRYQVRDDRSGPEIPLFWWLEYFGLEKINDKSYMKITIRPPNAVAGTPVEKMMETESGFILDEAAAISHPANYIVRVEPKLTEYEAKRVLAGKRYPAAKRPHFIVVDHDVVVGMRRGEGGHHASPVPHERRGHWRRLAERCKKAKLLGRDKTFVRPTLVGEPKFEDRKNYYEVLPQTVGCKMV